MIRAKVYAIEVLVIFSHFLILIIFSNEEILVRTTFLFLFIIVKPFLDTTRPYSPSHISATENNILQITLAIKSNPLPAIEWRFKAETDCNFNSIVSNTTTNGFLTSSSISIEKVQSSDLGDYIFTANNTFGIFFRRFVVIKQGKFYF